MDLALKQKRKSKTKSFGLVRSRKRKCFLAIRTNFSSGVVCKLKSRKGLNKIFKYRPLSDFLFKELFYQEIYFASYNELNDPLDLSARVEFSTKDIEEIEYLIYFAFRTQFELKETSNYKKLVSLFNSKESLFLLKNEILKNLNIFLEENDLILTNDIVSFP